MGERKSDFMIVLGISSLDRDATVTLIVNDRVVFALAEERLSRIKLHAGFPYLALDKALKSTAISARDIDHVAYDFFDWKKEAKLMNRNRVRDFRFNCHSMKPKTAALVREARKNVTRRNLDIPGLSDPLEKMEKPLWKRLLYAASASDGWTGSLINHYLFRKWLRQSTSAHRKYQQELFDGLRSFGLLDKLCRYEHHKTHAANAFYCSGFERALVVTIDAYGSGLAGTISAADRSGMRRISEMETPYSLGLMFESVTWGLGFVPYRHGGKIVGLAAYGDPTILSDILRDRFVWQGGRFRIRRSSNVYFARYLGTKFPKIDVAAAYQRVLEEVVTRQVSYCLKQNNIDSVVLSGGVAANVKLNQRLHDLPGVRSVYVHANMGDGGCGTGAAILKMLELGIRPVVPSTAFLGPEFSSDEIESRLRSSGLPYQRSADIEKEIAARVADNQIVARFDGRMEYGPRALGNRSILYPAQDSRVNQWLNARLGRTEFMPFAPATLYEDRDKCYRNVDGAEFTAEFMTITFDCTSHMKETCPAAVHVDGTARPQLVNSTSNPSFYRILSEYKRLTGHSSMINTSFNMHEEPIVCTPDDAIRAFQLGRLDCLAIGPFMVVQAKNHDAETS